MKKSRIDLTGQLFGRLTVVAFAKTDKHGNAQWICQCSCGETTTVWSSALRRNLTQSCGCLRKAATSARRSTHGKSAGDPTYRVWTGMKKRCENPNSHGYARYGGRGIAVCTRWEDFALFLEDMGPKPEGCSIERLDVDKGYAPDNCRWIPCAEQARNKSTSRKITAAGETLLLVDWAARTGIAETTIASRIDKLGWSAERAVTTPPRGAKRRSGGGT